MHIGGKEWREFGRPDIGGEEAEACCRDFQGYSIQRSRMIAMSREPGLSGYQEKNKAVQYCH